MPYLMEMEIRKLNEQLTEQSEDFNRQIAQLKKVIEYDVEEIKILKDRLIALGGDPDAGIRARLLAQTAMPARNKRARVGKL